MKRFILTSCVLAMTTACSSPTPPTIDVQDITNANAALSAARLLPITQTPDLPTGSAVYQGHFGSEANVDGDDFYAILGDMEMTIAFDSAGVDVSGTLDNINLIEDGEPQQLLGGELSLSGSAPDGSIVATAQGSLSAVGEGIGIRGSSSANLSLFGNVVSDSAGGDTVVGEVSGSASGDFSVSLFGENGFSGKALP